MSKLTGYLMGHQIYLDLMPGVVNTNWRYVDTNESIYDEPNTKRLCPKCNKPETEDGHDPCIANLPGVKFACCGHGIQDGYITFDNDVTIRGSFVVDKKENK